MTNQNLDGTSASISTPELSIGQPQPDLEFNDFSQQHFQSKCAEFFLAVVAKLAKIRQAGAD